MISESPPLMWSHLNRQRAVSWGGKVGVGPTSSLDPKNPYDVLWPLRRPVSSSVREAFGPCLILQILCASSGTHLKFPITADTPCGEHLAGWHTF